MRHHIYQELIVQNKRILFFFILLTIMYSSVYAQNTDPDLQSWNVVRLTNHFNEKWSLNLQEETRFQDDISKLNQVIVKLNGRVNFNEKIGLNFGFKYIYRPTSSNEWEPWQEVLFPKSFNKFSISQNFRLEERFYQGIEGIIPRIRYLFNYHIPIGKKQNYLTGYSEVRFNLVNKGTGPVEGFEQVRFRLSYGFHINDFMDIEVGYLYRFEVNRNSPNLSDQVIHIQIPFSTGYKTANKKYRADS
ncbi:DUF2490 domain-containing protein [Formosa maritima]|uniref:DUF2490 domain-containing protein n=1 Tax=Formosa maritima TaxID=2592046 RepID=A0A5D0GAF4_9FLAO|nr:DUF2490 domain-containing protein [Formosa maritima]TYA54802.1 DUF2490 domain-containing protein [Formosa maritima]